MIGIIGNLLILTSMVACVLSGVLFFRSAKGVGALIPAPVASVWTRVARGAWLTMTLSSATAFGLLMYLSVTHDFSNAYVYQNTSLDLGLKFLISATWAGQEGSFLLWIIMNAAVGLAVIRLAREYEAPVMAIIALCQAFLISMIVGIELGPLPIGSSPFATLMDKFPDAPMIQAGIIPTDGQGLNDLLQNYWMVIHPPILFVGFAAMIVPFAFAVTALWKRQYTQWVRPALPWTLFAVMALGVGIMLGGYWAYETLSFGGYWAWDPVENSSLVPWLIGVAAVHTMIVQKRSGHSQKASLFLAVLAYMLVVYSTFLTRSGILGEISVHSFVDLGLYNQLLIWILTMGVIGFGLFAARYSELPTPKKEPEMLSREFMIFMGAMVLCAISAVIIVGTSAPILGRIFRDSPSAVPLEFYNKWTLPLSIVFVFLAGMAQLFWWNKMNVRTINRVLMWPTLLAVLSTAIIVVVSPFRSLIGDGGSWWEQNSFGMAVVLLVFVSFFALYGNGSVLWRIARGNLKLAGGATGHVGMAIMMLGIVASSVFGNAIGSGVQVGDNRDNFILTKGQTLPVNGYVFTYNGRGENKEGRPVFNLTVTDPADRTYEMSPVVYMSNKGQWIQHPSVRQFVEKDIFLAVAPNEMFETGDEDQGQINLARGDSTVVGNDEYVITFDGFDLNVEPEFLTDSTEVAVGALVRIEKKATGEFQSVRPIYIIERDRSVSFIENSIPEWGLTIAFTAMNVDNGEVTLALDGVRVTPDDWLVVQAYEKPLISLVWIGFIILTGGFLISVVRRAGASRD